MVRMSIERGIMIKLAVVFVTALLTTGCINVTEHEVGYTAGLQVFSANDFSPVMVIPDIPGARSLLIYPGNIFVVSTEGKIFRYDSETMELIEEYQIAAASAAGFSEIVYCSTKNSAYLIGAHGNILEISLPDCMVLDEFSVCQAPVKLALASGSRNLFVGDGTTSRVFQVATSNNSVPGSVELFFNIHLMETLPLKSPQNTDSMIVSTTDGLSMVEAWGPGNLRSILFDKYPRGNFLDFAAVPNDSFFVAIYHSLNTEKFTVGSYRLTVPYVPPPAIPPYKYFGVQRIPNNINMLSMGHDYQHAYVLSYLGDNTSRLSAYNYRTYEITREVDIPGYPIDIQASGGGYIYVLTAHQ